MGFVSETAAYYQNYGARKTVKKIAYKTLHVDRLRYMRWRKLNCPTREELIRQRRESSKSDPLISIVIPLYKSDETYLRELVRSILRQSYVNYEVCMSDGSGADYEDALIGPHCYTYGKLLDDIEAMDKRIHIVRNEKALRISDNTNAAMKIARGDFIAFADHDDLLSPDALYEVAQTIAREPQVDIIYSDEDKVDSEGKGYHDPYFKTDYNPEMLEAVNYFCHLLVIRKSLCDRIGEFDPAMDGAQDHDYILRAVEESSRVCHIPKVLYHWRTHDLSTALNPDSKKYAYDAGAEAIKAHYERTGVNADVVKGQLPGLYRTIHHVEDGPLVSVIIPNKDHGDDLLKCIDSICKDGVYNNLEIIVAENNSSSEETFELYRQLEEEHENLKVVSYEGEFNFSAVNNHAVQYARGEYLLFLNNDTEMISPESIEDMLGYCMRKGAGAVGAKLLYPDRSIQHAGVIVGFGGFAGHAFITCPYVEPGYFARIWTAQDYSAVTAACMMVKRSAFEEVGGFDESFKVALNDIDLCMRLGSAGYRIIYDPDAEFFHYESRSRGAEDSPEKQKRFKGEVHRFRERWRKELDKGDPFYSPNLSLVRCDFSVNV